MAFDHLLDRRLERSAGDLDQALRLVVDLADRDGDRGVAVPTLDDRPAVDREDVAFFEHNLRTRDPVHDHIVGRRAHDGREPVVVQEVRSCASTVEHLASNGIHVEGGRARLRRPNALLVHLGHHSPRASHERDLFA